MSPGPHPHHHDLFHKVLRQTLDQDRNTPSGIARVRRGNITDDLLTDDGLETVRSDQEVTFDASCRRHRRSLTLSPPLFKSNDPAVQSNRVALEFEHLRRDQTVNISAMNLVVRRAMQVLVLIGQRKSLNLFTGVMKPEDVGPGSNAHFC